jgi:GxxExxY protein
MHTDNATLNGLTERIIGCAFTVLNTLKSGFVEKVYENALAHELTKSGLMVSQQIAVNVHYDGVNVGAYTADLLVENAVLVELKAVRALDPIHSAQCLNYLMATGLPVCLLFNFGNPRLEIRRLINGQAG